MSEFSDIELLQEAQKRNLLGVLHWSVEHDRSAASRAEAKDDLIPSLMFQWMQEIGFHMMQGSLGRCFELLSMRDPIAYRTFQVQTVVLMPQVPWPAPEDFRNPGHPSKNLFQGVFLTPRATEKPANKLIL